MFYTGVQETGGLAQTRARGKVAVAGAVLAAHFPGDTWKQAVVEILTLGSGLLC